MAGFFQKLKRAVLAGDTEGFLSDFREARARVDFGGILEIAASRDVGVRRATNIVQTEFENEAAVAVDASSCLKISQDFNTCSEFLPLDSVAFGDVLLSRKRDLVRSEYNRQLDTDGADAEKLQQMAVDLKIPYNEVQGVVMDVANVIAARKMHKVLDDGRLSPIEELELDALAKYLGIGKIELDDGGGLLNMARERYALENLPLPFVPVDILLQKNEYCRAAVAAEASEVRTRTTRINYSGMTATFRIARGVSFRSGSIRVDRETENYRHTFGNGLFYVTDKRLIWVGPNKTISIKFSTIIDAEYYSDGIKIRRSSGKPLLIIYEKSERIGIIASRIIDFGGAPVDV